MLELTGIDAEDIVYINEMLIRNSTIGDYVAIVRKELDICMKELFDYISSGIIIPDSGDYKINFDVRYDIDAFGNAYNIIFRKKKLEYLLERLINKGWDCIEPK